MDKNERIMSVDFGYYGDKYRVTMSLPNGKIVEVTDLLKVRMGEGSKLIPFKTTEGFIVEVESITEVWDYVPNGGLELLYSKDGDE